MFTTAFPIITTADLGAALGFYRDLLGATVSYEAPGPDGEPVFVGLELGTAQHTPCRWASNGRLGSVSALPRRPPAP